MDCKTKISTKKKKKKIEEEINEINNRTLQKKKKKEGKTKKPRWETWLRSEEKSNEMKHWYVEEDAHKGKK